MSFAVVVLAAGRGTRMRSRTPKVLHEIAGRPLVAWPIAAALAAGASRVIVVQGPDRPLDGLVAEAGSQVVSAIQTQADGTAGAVVAAQAEFEGHDVVVVLPGDAPLVDSDAIRELVDRHTGRGAAATVLGAMLDDPSGYGRLVRDEAGDLLKIVETKTAGDATEAEMSIREVNAGVYAFDGAQLPGALAAIGTDNAQGERYLPDALAVLRDAGGAVGAVTAADPAVILGVNDRWQLAQVTLLARERINREHALAGVTFVHAASAIVDADVTIGEDTIIEPGVQLLAGTAVGRDCRIGQGTVAVGSDIADGATVRASTLDGASVGEGVSVGPYAYLRPGARLEAGAKAGTFVEIKNSVIGEGTKVPHLSYIGDADVGPGSNLGAGTITANYDGRNKHRTTIGAGVRGGVDTSFIAPVTVGDGAWTAAGSVVTKDVPAGALAVARARQHNVAGYADRES
ncbi:MAG: bifunctional UDP-N-acetylglucosamine diphosphorylase/glucosamine-1-phosphate N-acetyltransferase GlmU [Solirubrobacteraceae bacterium]|nr:bifunctional UDP-N-acetylglucosamine diphosphorylase/glucosamine-1-phosphate N-acetyltransferase GlmU [Solirubrobacteraceae bacterium]